MFSQIKLKLIRLQMLSFVFLLLSFIYGGTTGKVRGVISDKDTGERLPGTNISIVNSSMGSSADSEGAFVIINISPGTYDLRLSMIGYGSVRMRNVRVDINQTTDVGNIKMSTEVLTLDEIVVQANKNIVDMGVSGSYLNIESDDIAFLPVTDISQVIGLQAGIEGLEIRGSSESQSAFMVDGFLLNDERSNKPYTSVSLSTVKEVQVQTGGFNAEYGNIRSGVINIITDDASLSEYHGSFMMNYSPPAQKHFDTSVYDTNSYFLRPYLDNDVCWTGTDNGSWDEQRKKQYPAFEGWNEISYILMNDDSPNNDLTPEGLQKLFEFQHRRNGVIKRPDQYFDATIGGPLPVFLGVQNKNLRFSLSHHHKENMFVIPLSMDGNIDYSTRLKLLAHLSKQTKVNITTLLGETHSVSPYVWKTTPTGSVLESTYDVANIINGSSGNSIIFMPGYYSPTTISRKMFGLKINHMFNPNEYFEFILQYMNNQYNTYQIEERDTSKTNEVIPNYFVDEAPYGYWGYGETGYDGMSIGGWMNLGRDKTVNSTILGRLDYVNQINNRHQLKSGLSFTINNYNVKSSTVNPSMSTWNRSLVYNISPYRGAIYIQDKIETEGFIANIGVRAEISSANADIYTLDVYDEYYSQGLGNDIEEEVEKTKSKSVITASPRLGISHPITDDSKLYFNYGHFYSEPASAYRFRLQRESNGLVTHMGNPDMSLERTIAYEVGYSKSFNNSLLVNITAYYKDVTDQSGWVYYQNVDNSVQYKKASNNNYEDIRGLELSFSKSRGKWFSGFMNFTYLVKTSGYFGLLKYFQDPNLQSEYERTNIYQEKPNPRPYIRTQLSFYTPVNFGPKVLSEFYPLSNWIFSTIGYYKTGAFATYNPDNTPGIRDNVQWKDKYGLDLRIDRTINVSNIKVKIFADIYNVLNLRFLSYSGFSDYYDYVDYIESLHLSWEEGTESGNDRLGDYRLPNVEYTPYNPIDPNNPTRRDKEILRTKAYIDMPNFRSLTFLDPRDISIGVQIEF